MTKTEIEDIFKDFQNKKVLIVGDAMIDSYMWGEVERMSPEAPVPIVEVHKHEDRLGGAGNVARNIKSLGAQAILCSVIGNDQHGYLFRSLMKKEELSKQGIIKSDHRKTTIKIRVISENKHQLRVDEEDTHPIQVEDEMLTKIDEIIDEIDVIILQDYNKGVLTPKVIKEIIIKANNKNIPTIVDPKKKNFESFKNCSIFKPNLSEIQAGMNIEIDGDNKKQIETATSDLRKQLNAEAILLTLSEKGICINTKEEFSHTPIFTKDIVDVSGAGDTVISVASLLLSSNIKLTTLSKISSLAGGLVCKKVGVVPINKEELLKESIKVLSKI